MVLAVEHELALETVRALLQDHGIAHVAIRESDEPYAGQLCAIGLEPTADRRKVRKVVSSLPLLR